MSSLESVGIRRATGADETALFRVMNRAGEAVPHRLEALRGLVDSPQHFIYLAEDSAPFGFVAAGRCQDDLLDDDSVGEIIALYLDADHQGFGMGRKLLVRGVSVLKRRAFESALAWLPAEADRAIDAFGAVGFEPNGMERELNTSAGVITEVGFATDLDRFF